MTGIEEAMQFGVEGGEGEDERTCCYCGNFEPADLRAGCGVCRLFLEGSAEEDPAKRAADCIVSEDGTCEGWFEYEG